MNGLFISHTDNAPGQTLNPIVERFRIIISYQTNYDVKIPIERMKDEIRTRPNRAKMAEALARNRKFPC